MKEKIVQNANSKGVILDYMHAGGKTQQYGMFGFSPRFDPAKALKVVRNDPVVRAAMITLVDKTLESGWRLSKDNDKSGIKTKQDKLKQLRFDRFTRKILFNLFMYNNAFGEVVKKNGEVSDLNVVEPEFMKIDADDNGDVKGYYQELGLKDSNPYWTTEEMVHYKIDDYISNTWSDFNVEALYETVLIKDYVRQWLQWFFGTNQLRPVLRFDVSASDKVVKDTISYLKAAEKNLKLPLPVAGGMEIDRLQEFDKTGQTVMNLVKILDEQILILLQVPPIAVGMPDQSGRSNSVEQYQALNTRMLSVQRQYEDYTNYDLFPIINYERVTFRFGVLDESVRKQTFEIVQIMRDSQFKDEPIIEYLESQGIVFESKDIFKDDAELAALSNKDLGTGHEGMKGNANADASPSRSRNGGGSQGANRQVQVKNALSKFQDKMRYW